MKIKVSAEEILAGKFKATIEKLNGYLQEARGDAAHGTSWGGRAAYDRLAVIKNAFEQDLKTLAQDLDLSGDDVGEIGKKLDEISGTLKDGVAVKSGRLDMGPR